RTVLADQVLHAAVCAQGHLPLEAEVEIVEGVDRDDVAAALPFVLQPAVFDDPALIGERGFLEAAPSTRRLAVEERAFACGRLRAERGDAKDDSDERCRGSFHREPLHAALKGCAAFLECAIKP